MRPGLLLVAFLTVLAPAPAAAQVSAPTETATYYFMMGRYLENEGRIEEAIAAHRKAIELAPDAAEPYGELAGLFARQNRAVEALQAAEAALKREPNNREANRILGTIYGALSEQGQVLRKGDDPDRYAELAIAALEKSREGTGFDPNVELMLGRLYSQQGEPEKAVEPLRRVVEEYPGYPDAALLLAEAYADAGQADEGAAILEKALAENPAFFRGRLRLAELYEEQQRFKEAAAAYAAARKINPRANLLGAEAAALINGGDAAEARRILTEALSGTATPDASQLYLLGQAERRLGNGAGASEVAARLRKAHPGDLRALYLDAQIASDAGRHDEAIKAFQALAAAVPDDPTFIYQQAFLLDEAGRPAEAEKLLRARLEREPDDAQAMNSLGYMFAERGERLDEAVELLHRALEIEPGNPSYLDSLGWAYFRQGRDDLAEEPLAKAASALPQTSVVQEHLGDLRFRQKRFAEAIAAWERALQGDGEDIDRAAIEKKLQDARARLGK